MILKAIRGFRRKIYYDIIKLNHAFEEQMTLKDEIDKFNDSNRQKTKIKKKKKH